MVNTTDIVELELKSKRFSLAMRKKEAIAVPEPPQVRRLCRETLHAQVTLKEHGQHVVSTGQQLRKHICKCLRHELPLI